MTFARRLNHVDNLAQQDSAERAFNKLARTFTAQVEALKLALEEAHAAAAASLLPPGHIADGNGNPIMQPAPAPPDFLLLPLGGTREQEQVE